MVRVRVRLVMRLYLGLAYGIVQFIAAMINIHQTCQTCCSSVECREQPTPYASSFSSVAFTFLSHNVG